MATLKYTVKSSLTGKTYTGRLGYDIKKTLDRRSDRDAVQIVYQCREPNGTWTRVWTDECAGVDAKVVERYG